MKKFRDRMDGPGLIDAFIVGLASFFLGVLFWAVVLQLASMFLI